ncbi:unnamed protein product [Cylindrotheca closterium]|uniref:SAP domain-containing protein n=1 Tax=Cylindrotheca closterium TaxID=2856 RepID=A0AAD2FE92_9STRA|nr:unnamed protein product [Cylindrotheca closterium]
MKLLVSSLLLVSLVDVSRAFTPICAKHWASTKDTTILLPHATETDDDWYADFNPDEYKDLNAGYSSSPSPSRSSYSSSSGGGGYVDHDYHRDIAADNSDVDLDTVNTLIAERLQLRKTGRFEEADAMRDQLLEEHGVTVRDKEGTWRSGCSSRRGGGGGGGRGRGSERGGDRGGGRRPPQDFGPNGHDYNLAADAGPNASTLSEPEIHQMLAERLECKLNRDYRNADRIQEDLRNAGVVVNDREKMWRSDGLLFQDNSVRRYNQSRESAPTEDSEEIQSLINQRSKAKAQRNYNEADEIRDTLLNEFDVTIDDRRAEWSVGGAFGMVTERVNNRNRGFERAPGCPPTENDAQIAQMLEERDAARSDRDFDTADNIKEELKMMDVYIDDRKKQWSIGGAEAKKSDSYHRRGGGSLTESEEAEITNLLAKRFVNKKNRQFKSADAIRDQLKEQYNVQIDDRNFEWHVVTDGFTMSPSSAPVSEETQEIIDGLVAERALAKLNKDYDTADSIRDLLMSEHNVSVDDRVKEWQVISSYESESQDEIRAVAVNVEADVETDSSIDSIEEIQGELQEELQAELQEELQEELEEDDDEEDEEEEEPEEAVASAATESMEDLKKLTIPMLKDKLRELELPVGGKKAELIERILGE